MDRDEPQRIGARIQEVSGQEASSFQRTLVSVALDRWATRRRSAATSRVPGRSASCRPIRHCSPRESPAARCRCLTDSHPGRKNSAALRHRGYPVYVVRVFCTRPQNGVKAGLARRFAACLYPATIRVRDVRAVFLGVATVIIRDIAVNWPKNPPKMPTIQT